MNINYHIDFNQFALKIKQLGKELGFDQIGITTLNFNEEVTNLKTWINSGYHGDMRYFEKRIEVFEQPQKLLTENTRVISCLISYPQSLSPDYPLASYAQLQDYSMYICRLLKDFAEKIFYASKTSPKFRVFAGNVPILEKAIAINAGLGWRGKNSLLINEKAGSFSFLGEILIDLPLPIDKPIPNHCGNCSRCIDNCPTKALTPYKIDARRCISYLTGIYDGSIPIELRPLIGTRIFGCDECQLRCPWNNKKTNLSSKNHPLVPKWEQSADGAKDTINNLIAWFVWEEKEFYEKTKNSPINRISYECWLRNIAIALGNTHKNNAALEALRLRQHHPSQLVREHVEWGIKMQSFKT